MLRSSNVIQLLALFYYFYFISELQVHIDFELLSIAFKKYIREKAAKANSTIVYKMGNQQIEENPKISEKKILREYTH